MLAARSFASCLGIVLAVLATDAASIDPPTVQGRLTYDGRVYVLRHVYAWQPPAPAGEVWIYLTDNPLPPDAAAHETLPEQLARAKRFGGAKLVVRAVKPRLQDMKGIIYAPREDGYSQDTFNFGPEWRRLVVGDKRVTGSVRSRWMGWTLDAEFSAPIHGNVVTK